MGIADRDYVRNEEPRQSMPRLTPVVKWLLMLNIGIFVLDYLVLSQIYGMRADCPPMLCFGAFAVQSAVMEGRIWEFITFQFLHDSVAHVGFNCLGLFIFGPIMERWWGGLRFLIFYLLCGSAGAAAYTVLVTTHLIPGNVLTPLVGASAGIYGILIGVAVIAPHLRVTLLFPPVELSMRQLALWMMAVSIAVVLFRIGDNEGGEVGHLGGAIFGYLLMRYPRLLGTPRRPPVLPNFPPPGASKLRPRSELRIHEDPEVDAILDKISANGFQSLSHAEREILRKASEHHNSAP